MPVVNIKKGNPHDGIYIGRGSPYGNPFFHGDSSYNTVKMGSREEAIEAFRAWMTTDLDVPGWTKPTREMVIALAGRTLACFCAPLPCHGDVLLELAELWSAA